VQKMKSLSS